MMKAGIAEMLFRLSYAGVILRGKIKNEKDYHYDLQ